MKVRIHVLIAAFVVTTLFLSCSSSSQSPVSFSISEHNFGSIYIGITKELSFTITNKKNKILTLLKTTVSSSEFLVVAGGGSNTKIQPNSEYEVKVKFIPALPGGLKLATLKFEYSFGYDPMYKEIALQGTSVPIPQIQVSPSTYDYQSIVINTKKSNNFQLSNIGTATMKINSLIITGTDASDFTLTAGTTGTIAPQNSQVLTVEFSPAVIGTKNATLQIHHDAKNVSSPVTVSLTGIGYDVPVFSITPASPFDYGRVAKGDKLAQKFTIENIGAADMNVTKIDISGDFAVISGNAPFKILPGATHDVEVEFSPTQYGTRQGAVSFRSDTLTSPDSVSLAGEGYRGLPFEESFDNVSNGQLPTDWTVTRGSTSTTSSTQSWQVQSSSNETGGTGRYVVADADVYNMELFEDYLISPSIDCTAYTSGTVTFEFDGKFKSFLPTYEFTAVEVYDGANWYQLESWSTGWNANGEHKSYDITQYALGNSNLQVRFLYKTMHTSLYWFQIDNVKISK